MGTTITNWESILYHLNKQKLIHEPNYFKDLNEGFLDVVLPDNPNPLGMCVKLIRAYVCKDASRLSASAVKALSKSLEGSSFDEIRAYESAHYRKRYIDWPVYSYLREHKGIENPDLLPVELDNVKETLPLV